MSLKPIVASKVPEITVLFWVVKVLTTGMGETTSDFLVTKFDPVVTVPLAVVALAVAVVAQFRRSRYVPWLYWLTVVLVSVVGTMVADVVHVGLGVPYLVSAPLFAVALAAIFVAWWRTERTLSIHAITTRRREAFYWLTVGATFALGTATGDLTATTFHLGYLPSGVVFAVAMLVPAALYALRVIGPISAFWIAYVLTRPLGASFADWMGVTHQRGGLDWGTGPVSLALLALIVIGVGLLSARRPTLPGGVVAE